MSDLFRQRTARLQQRLMDEDVDIALLAYPDSVYYFTAHWGDLGVEFGRPTVAAVTISGDVTLITAEMETEMARALTWVDDVRGYADGIGGEWRDPLLDILNRTRGKIGFERYHCPPMVTEFLRQQLDARRLIDTGSMLSSLRMIKSAEEIRQVRQAGQVAVAMGHAGKEAIAEGVPEYEICIACMNAGTRKAAEIIGGEDPGSFMTPVIHNLQVLNSAHFTSMTHRHPTVRKLERGDPVYMCFCCIAHFKQLKLGYDREYFLASVTDEQGRVYEAAIEAQRAAVSAIRPGVTAEAVHFEALEVYQKHGFGNAYRTGRAIGYSSLEKPELKAGDKTVLAPGMVFAVDGGITVPGKFGARVGDTIIVTERGSECATEYPRDLTVL
ncbi:MAG: Xaa-Pro peptidase family protein [Gammaproteobacteria bacterium]|nr:Xaa-Pro peptidase family protein [Gammaproteobacteria bacterium]